jgi:hypothetical protein
MHSAIIFLKQACENNSLYTMALLSGMIVWDVVVDVLVPEYMDFQD